MNGEYPNRKVLCDIANCAFEVINNLLARDQELARELRSRETSSHQIYREESITVEMATELRKRFPNQVQITLFTPLEETRTGADWYWRIEKAGQAIHARVQAKRVQRTEFGQSDEFGLIDLDGPQLIQLVEAARQPPTELAGLQAWLATYARFDATPPCGMSDLMRCGSHRHQSSCRSHQPSLWIADAKTFASGHSQQLPIRQVIGNSVRLDCVLPCIGEQDGAGPEDKGFVLQSGLGSYEECITAIESNIGLRSKFKGALRIQG